MDKVLAFPAQPAVITDLGQRVEALDTARSFIVEAPAGSGKTGLLIQRLLRLLASERVTHPGQILAITFTRKATHEMRDRVMQQLAAAAAGGEPANDFDRQTRAMAEAALARDRSLGWGLLDHPDRLNISTIDSFCAQIARSLPVLSGAGGQAPVEDASELYGEAAARTLDLLGGEDAELNAALELVLLHRDGDLGNCAKLIGEMLGWRDQWGELVPLVGARPGEPLTDEYLETVTRKKLERALEQVVCRALTRLDQAMPAGVAHELALLSHRMSAAAGYRGADSPLAICRELKTAPGVAAADLEHWRVLAFLLITPSGGTFRKATGIQGNHLKFEITKRDKAELVELIDSVRDNEALCDALCALTMLPPLAYPEQQWKVAKALFRVLSRALVELQLVFAGRGECDFTEFSLVAREALGHAGVAEELAAGGGYALEHLLVDEMQDTSSSQYELIRLLTEHWDGAGQTVLLVGDPKQSIYLFRQARVARFIETLRAQRLGDLPLKALYLSANFRSQAGLVGAFNETFRRVFPAEVDAGDHEAVPYRAAAAIRARAEGPGITWHARVLPYSADAGVCAEERAAARQQNAEEMRGLIEAWRARPRPAGREGKTWKIAVLVRNRRHLLAVVKALKQEPAVAYRAVKVEALGERQEVLDLLALTRALLHPADRTAWLGLLRTPWCGLTLRDLHLLAGADDAAWDETTVLGLMEERGDLLSEDGVGRLEVFWNVMAAALGERGRLPLARWVERTWRGFGAEAFCDEEARANVARYFALLDELEARPGPVSLERLQAMIGRLYAAESTAADAVDLMTIHNAKGLEWDFVVVPELESGTGVTGARLLSWLELEGGEGDVAHGMIAPVQAKGGQAEALNKWMRSVDAAREAAERKRLFYVVCTRAREELHLFASPDGKKEGGAAVKADSLLRAAWEAAADHMQVAEPGVLDLAAVSGAAGLELVAPRVEAVRTIERVPAEAFPGASRMRAATAGPVEAKRYARPEGSFEARAVGNAMHALLELAAERMAAGADVKAEVPGWSARTAHVLRAGGLAPDAVSRAAATIERGLLRTLGDADGRWVLAAHPQAVSEASLGFAGGSIRLDRSFLAGAVPGSVGETHLWVVDWKTGTHAEQGLDAYLEGEKAKYRPQLEGYAERLASRGLPMRLALYYPLLAKLMWWEG